VGFVGAVAGVTDSFEESVVDRCNGAAGAAGFAG
jgi:hypothetical protein